MEGINEIILHYTFIATRPTSVRFYDDSQFIKSNWTHSYKNNTSTNKTYEMTPVLVTQFNSSTEHSPEFSQEIHEKQNKKINSTQYMNTNSNN